MPSTANSRQSGYRSLLRLRVSCGNHMVIESQHNVGGGEPQLSAKGTTARRSVYMMRRPRGSLSHGDI